MIGNSRFAVANPQAVKAAVAANAVEGAKPATEAAARKIEAPLPTAFFRDIAPPKPASEVAPANSARSVAPSAAATNVAAAKAVTPVQSATATLAPGAAGAAPQSPLAPAAFAAEPKPKSNGPMFQTLFHEGERGAVAPVVRELWGARVAPSTAASRRRRPVAPAAARRPRPAARASTRRSTCSASCGRRAAPDPRPSGLKNSSTTPDSYGERFVKPHGLQRVTSACSAVVSVGSVAS